MTTLAERPTPAGTTAPAERTVRYATAGGHKARKVEHNSRLDTRGTTAERHWAPKRSGDPDPAGHLTPEQIDELGRRLDALRDEVLASRGAADARYIRTVIATQRGLEMGSRLILLVSRNRIAWVVGTAGLSVAKILDNMEIGHNIIHGQWDWMRDERIHSSTWEWDHASPAKHWKHSHNELHHTYTNVIGKDNDLGFGIMRMDADQPWHPMWIGQPLWNFLNACVFEHGIALYDLQIGAYLNGNRDRDEFWEQAREVAEKIGTQALKDYVVHPALSGPSWKHTLAATFTANLVRNLWSHAIIVCGHFADGVQTFSKRSIEGESRGEWYLRQMTGSCNISGGPLLHLMSGNLSHQIEHHCFPDMPSNRYAQVAPQVRALAQEHGLVYVTGPLHRQLFESWRKCFTYALPNGAWQRLADDPVEAVGAAVRWGRKAVARQQKRKRIAALRKAKEAELAARKAAIAA